MDIKTFIEVNSGGKFINIFRNYAEWDKITSYNFAMWYVYGNNVLGF